MPDFIDLVMYDGILIGELVMTDIKIRKNKEQKPQTSHWLEEIQERTKKGKENHYLETLEKITNLIEQVADQGYNSISFTDYRQEEADKLVNYLRAFGFKAKEVFMTYEYDGDYISVNW